MAQITEVKPIYDGVLIRPLSEESRTRGGLYIPDMHHGNTPYARGEVVEVGVGRPTADGAIVPLQVKKGQIVLYQRTAGIRFPLDGDRDVSLMPETAIFAILTIEETSIIELAS
jgi:chaperonin GroES